MGWYSSFRTRCDGTEVDLRNYTCCIYSIQWLARALVSYLDRKGGSKRVQDSSEDSELELSSTSTK